MPWLVSGVGTEKSIGECIGPHGSECVYPNAKVVWVFVICMLLILPCFLNKVGDLLLILTLSVHKFRGQNTIQMGTC